jgi:acyl-coenzyme A synthetase/AMP-(fatty) acid ligase
MNTTTLLDLLESNRHVDRAVTYVEGENSERRVPYGDVYARALGILYHLQAMGAQRGDKMIIFLNNNEQFLDGFWAARGAEAGQAPFVHRLEESRAPAGPRRAGG